jgi:uncharacterized protein (DUF58 family)
LNEKGSIWLSRRHWLNVKRRIFPRGLSVTREGKVYIGVTLGVGFAAINTGNNLLFLVLGLLLGLIIVSGILSEITLRRIEVRRQLPKRVEVGVPFSVELCLNNGKRLAASFAVELRDEIDGEPFKRRCFFLRVGAREERSVAYRCELEQRGIAHFDGVIVSTRYPFGLFDKTRFVPLTDEVIALPGSVPFSVSIPLAKAGEGAEDAAVIGIGGEFRELREMAPGDDPRRIHWRATARLGRPIIRVTNADAKGFVEIVLDAAPARPAAEALEQVEQNIRIAATVIRDATKKGMIVRLITSDEDVMMAGDGPGSIALLEHLALIDPLRAINSSPPMGTSSGALLLGPRAGLGRMDNSRGKSASGLVRAGAVR